MHHQILNIFLAAIATRNLAEEIDERSKIIQFIDEQNVQTVSKLISETPYPLDNLRGNSVLCVEKEISHSRVAEISIGNEVRASARLSVEAFDVLKAELFSQISAQTGRKIGETLTRREKITMIAQPKSKVTYIVKWFESVRIGECIFSIDRDTFIIPYETTYDLHSEVIAG
ncbi:MAG: hypothetical protein EA342_05340 [Leptolyngbya sp. LCM1.Bin17]|nr:MAG: hypothetical protein EA342_05340 [Leptolyngbya sp. LCM1.Bin17]